MINEKAEATLRAAGRMVTVREYLEARPQHHPQMEDLSRFGFMREWWVSEEPNVDSMLWCISKLQGSEMQAWLALFAGSCVVRCPTQLAAFACDKVERAASVNGAAHWAAETAFVCAYRQQYGRKDEQQVLHERSLQRSKLLELFPTMFLPMEAGGIW